MTYLNIFQHYKPDDHSWTEAVTTIEGFFCIFYNKASSVTMQNCSVVILVRGPQLFYISSTAISSNYFLWLEYMDKGNTDTVIYYNGGNLCLVLGNFVVTHFIIATTCHNTSMFGGTHS